jgi:hypothetical protein
MTEMKRKIIRGAGVLAIAVAAGHFVQQSATPRAVTDQTAELAPEISLELASESTDGQAALSTTPTRIETVAAADALSASQPGTALAPVLAPVSGPKFQTQTTLSQPALRSPEAAPAAASDLPDDAQAAPIQDAPIQAAPNETPTLDTASVQSQAASPVECAPMLDLLSDDMGMIGITLIAPCLGDQDFTLRHSGLVISQRTNAMGSYFAFVPALSRDGAVSLRFDDGTELSGVVDVPALDGLRRVSLIWQAPDAFGIQALEGGAVYGDASAISADNPQTPLPGAMPTSGYLTRFGDANNPSALMAEVYTFPADAQIDAQVLIEAAVTPQSCGRDVLAELVQTVQGKPVSEELMLTLPECDGESGFLVLNIPDGEQSIAALN